MRLQTDSLFNLDQDAPSVYFLTFPEDTYYNLETGQITAVYRSFEPGPPLKYKEPTPKFNWVTSARDSTVLSYPCSEAQMSFLRVCRVVDLLQNTRNDQEVAGLEGS